MDATLDAAVGPAPAAPAPDSHPDGALAGGESADTPAVPAQAGPVTARRAARARAGAAAAAEAPAVPPQAGPGGSGPPAEPAQPHRRPVVTELRLSAFGPHRSAAFPLGPVTLFAGPSGSGKSQALAAYESLAALGSGATLEEAFPDPRARIPDLAVPDAQRRRGFRLGCTVDGPAGPVRLDLAVQAEPTLRIVGERLTQDGQILLATALRDPGRRSVQAAWLTGGAIGVTRAPLPDDRLGTALLPLRVAGSTAGQRQVLAAAEQVVVALRSVFPCDPRPDRMRAAVPPGRAGCWETAPTWPTYCAGPATNAAPATRCWPARPVPAAPGPSPGSTYGPARAAAPSRRCWTGAPAGPPRNWPASARANCASSRWRWSC